MKKRAAPAAKGKGSTAKGKLKGHQTFFPSPVSVASPDSSSNKPYDYDLPSFPTDSAAAAAAYSSLNKTPSPFLRRSGTPPSAKTKTTAVATTSDLKALSSSRIESLKRHLDVCHSDILKDFDASHARLSKRFKIQTKACMQLAEEAEKDYKKIAERVTEHTEILQASYAELIGEAHSTASRVCKVSIPELMQSMEKAIDGLRSRYKISTTPM
ncbi:hypothetical protein Cni_G07770 [Canna indica]|uniref:Uncharacterized protein n=1 Tax=Canna indica TaxID=4628 RepID=A0AAQ3K0W3_9LILI|nr:hypothetical protein Cni_G07770 [Canna indica]